MTFSKRRHLERIYASGVPAAKPASDLLYQAPATGRVKRRRSIRFRAASRPSAAPRSEPPTSPARSRRILRNSLWTTFGHQFDRAVTPSGLRPSIVLIGNATSPEALGSIASSNFVSKVMRLLLTKSAACVANELASMQVVGRDAALPNRISKARRRPVPSPGMIQSYSVNAFRVSGRRSTRGCCLRASILSESENRGSSTTSAMFSAASGSRTSSRFARISARSINSCNLLRRS